jgi:nucleoside-diphosphate-sugar epimerase
MRIGVTGSQGVLGCILTTLVPHADCFKGDIRKREDVLKWLDSKSFDALFHFAAVVPVNEVKEDPFRAYEVNVGGTLNLLSALRDKGLSPWILYASSSHVYQGSNSPIKEEHPIQPQNLYGETKYGGERVCEMFRDSYQAKICIARIFSFYHFTQKIPFLFPSILQRFESEDLTQPFFLRGAKSQRDIQNAEDVVKQLLKLMEKQFVGTVNVGSGRGVTIEEFVQKMAPCPLQIESDPNEVHTTLIADTSKLNEIMNYGRFNRYSHI